MNAFAIQNCYHLDMKDTTAIRRDNFKILLDEYRKDKHGGREFGAMTAFARYYDLNPTHVSQIRNGFSGIGDVLARQLEEKTGKPPRWMDDEHHLIDMSDKKMVAFLDVVLTLYKESPEHAKELVLQAYRGALKNQKDSNE